MKTNETKTMQSAAVLCRINHCVWMDLKKRFYKEQSVADAFICVDLNVFGVPGG